MYSWSANKRGRLDAGLTSADRHREKKRDGQKNGHISEMTPEHSEQEIDHNETHKMERRASRQLEGNCKDAV